MIKAVIFDLDDTLINERDFAYSAFEEISKFIADKYNRDEFNIYQQLLHLYQINKEKVFNRLLDNLGIEYTHNLINELIKIYRNHKPKIKLSHSNKKLILKLKKQGLKLGIITDGFEETQNNKIKVLKLNQLFDYIIVTDELGPNREFWKPHEKAFVMMRDYFDLKYNEMVYIGDNVNKDFDAPMKLGMHAIRIINHVGIYTGGKHIENLVEISEINEISEFIERHNE